MWLSSYRCLEFLEYMFWVHTYASCSSGTWQYQSHCSVSWMWAVELKSQLPPFLMWLWAGNWTFLSFCFSFVHDFEHEGNNYIRKLLRVLGNVCQNIYRCSKNVCCCHLLVGLGKNVYWNCLKNCPGLRKHSSALPLTRCSILDHLLDLSGPSFSSVSFLSVGLGEL